MKARTPRTPRARYTLTLEDSGSNRAPVDLRLRTALKRLLRGHGLRCTAIEPIDLDPLAEADNVGDVPRRQTPSEIARLLDSGKLVLASEMKPNPKPKENEDATAR